MAESRAVELASHFNEDFPGPADREAGAVIFADRYRIEPPSFARTLKAHVSIEPQQRL